MQAPFDIDSSFIETRVVWWFEVAGVVLLKKSMTPSSPSEPAGSWDSIHVFETAERGRQVRVPLYCYPLVLPVGVPCDRTDAFNTGPLQAHVNCDAAAYDAQELGEQGRAEGEGQVGSGELEARGRGDVEWKHDETGEYGLISSVLSVMPSSRTRQIVY